LKRYLFIAGVVLTGLALLFWFSTTPAGINAMINDSGSLDQSPDTLMIEIVVRAVNALVGVAGLLLAALGFRARND